MLQLRTREALGGGDYGWLRARHHFAVDERGNPAHARLGSLVVWNDDEIAPHSGFPLPLASGFSEDQDALQIDADARVLGATLQAGERIEYALQSTRYGYLVPARGRVMVNGQRVDQRVDERDGLAIAGETGIAITAIEAAEIILVDAA